MGTAKVVSLSARPWKVAQLCFEIGGILEQIEAQLGAAVTPFDFTTFYAGLGATAALDASLLTFDSAGILGAASVAASTLASLRAEPRAAALDRAVGLRQNAYYARYANIASIVTTATGYYGGGPTAKPALLQVLATLSQSQATQLDAAYTADGRTGVVKTTNSSLSSTTITTDASSSSNQGTASTTPELVTRTSSQSNQGTIGGHEFASAALGGSGFNPPGQGGALNETISQTSGSNSVEASFSEGTTGGTATETGISTERSSGSGASTGKAYAVETENIANTDYAYRVPAIENQAQNARAQISLIDQQFAQFLAGQNLPNLTTVMQNELKSIDLGVYQLQIGFLNTILMSPFAGTVTGLYKNPGDCVRPGEPVVRVEDNTTIYVLATFVHRGAINLGATVTVTTQLFDATGAPTILTGSVVAVRGRADDDLWDLVVQCINPPDGSGNPTFPIGYTFDYDNTTATVT